MGSNLWSKIKNWCYHSLTIAWGYVQILASAILLGLTQLGDLLNNDAVKSAVAGLGLSAKVMLGLAVTGAVLGPAGFITLAVRSRTVTKPTDENNQVTDA